MEDLVNVTSTVIGETIDFNGVLVDLHKTTATKSANAVDISTLQFNLCL
jgi:hypothetical protein